jgi:hypothetical protein
VSSTAIAHEVKIAGEIAGIWHIEPNHNPKAGVPARTWTALTRKGGKPLPLGRANCQLAVYTQPRQSRDKPILRPTLKAITAERYRGVPGADITFPPSGIYQIELSCTPKAKGDFQPFQMQYSVTVVR